MGPQVSPAGQAVHLNATDICARCPTEELVEDSVAGPQASVCWTGCEPGLLSQCSWRHPLTSAVLPCR